MKEILKNEFPEFTEVVTWPDIQYLMDKHGFHKNCILINSEKGLELYGSSAYRVNPDWLEKVKSEELPDVDDTNEESLELLVDYSFGNEDLENN